MSKLFAVVVAVLTVLVGWIPSVQAQQAQDKGAPVEFFACNWQDGKGMADLEKVNKKFVAWVAKNDAKYSAWILTPQLHAGVDFDVGWLGGWPDAVSFGKGQDAWMSGGRELAAEFANVMDCSAGHQMATSVVITAPDSPPGNGVVMFSECTMQEGKMPNEAVAAHREVGKAMKGMGSKASSWLFYPGIGAGNIDFHYWSVIAFKNYSEMGVSQEMYINGGGWSKAMSILAPVSRCRSPELYDVRLVRNGASS